MPNECEHCGAAFTRRQRRFGKPQRLTLSEHIEYVEQQIEQIRENGKVPSRQLMAHWERLRASSGGRGI